MVEKVEVIMTNQVGNLDKSLKKILLIPIFFTVVLFSTESNTIITESNISLIIKEQMNSAILILHLINEVDSCSIA